MTTHPRKPQDHKEPADVFDLDTLETEIVGRPFVFKVGGERFTLPAGGEADYRAISALDGGDFFGGFRGLLGDEQYARFSEHAITATRMGKLIEAYLDHQGMRPGELLASKNSSAPTENLSRPTSAVTTNGISATS
jgi:hypothetical protein